MSDFQEPGKFALPKIRRALARKTEMQQCCSIDDARELVPAIFAVIECLACSTEKGTG